MLWELIQKVSLTTQDTALEAAVSEIQRNVLPPKLLHKASQVSHRRVNWGLSLA